MFAILCSAAALAAGGSCSLQSGQDCYGNDISNAPASTPQDCCNLCLNNSACNAFTHDQFDQSGQKHGVCYMKSGCSDLRSSSACTAGTKSPPAPPAPPKPPTPGPPTPVPPLIVNEQGSLRPYYLSPYDHHKPTIVDGGRGLELKYSERFYLMSNPNKSHSSSQRDDFKQFNLVDRVLNVTVDLNGASCGCNAAFYLVSMPSTTGAGKGGDYYCDANDVGGEWCPEIDLLESNTVSSHTTMHECYNKDSCDKGGYGVRFGQGSHDFGPSGDYNIDTSQPFTASFRFSSDSMGSDGSVEDDRISFEPREASTPSRLLHRSATRGGQRLSATVSMHQNGRQAGPKKINDCSNMLDSLSQGMVLVVSYWGSNKMGWLDQPPCSESEQPSCPQSVKFSDITVAHA